jgi:hypothetical protein
MKATQAVCRCGKPITYAMCTFDYVSDRMEWVHDHSHTATCDKGMASPQ